MGKTEGQAPPDSQSLDSIILLTASTTSDDEYLPPELAEAVPDVSGYDTILLGFPVWWYVEPRIVDTFLDGAAIEGKRIVTFATSGGSDVAKCVSHMRSNYPNAEWGQGKLLNSGDPVAWAKSVTE